VDIGEGRMLMVGGVTDTVTKEAFVLDAATLTWSRLAAKGGPSVSSHLAPWPLRLLRAH